MDGHGLVRPPPRTELRLPCCPYFAWCIAVLHGNQPDGGTWFATAQLAAREPGDVHAAAASDATVRRALSLTGTRTGSIKGTALPTEKLAAAYDVSGWTAPDLFAAPVAELTNMAPDEVFAHADRTPTAPEGVPDHLRRRLIELLESWAVTMTRE